MASENFEDETLVFLHGFPQTPAMWTGVIDQLSMDCACLAPALPGYDPSSAAQRQESFTASALAAQIATYIEEKSPDRPVVVVGHDVGGFIAYALAIERPELVRGLVAINGVHPELFRHSLLTSTEQADASREYIAFLRSENAEAILSANGYEALLQAHSRVVERTDLPGEDPATLVERWSQPGVLSSMLAFYRASDVEIPAPAEVREDLASDFPGSGRIVQPHLLIWGEKDPYLRPSTHEGLGTLCDDLTVTSIPEAGHGIVGTHPEIVAREIKQFVSRLDPLTS